MRKIGKKSTLKGCYNQSSDAKRVNTNLEKKTQEKIRAMSTNDSLTMDFILKNRKLLEHLKKCKVFLSKSMRKNLLKKYAVLSNPMNRNKVNHSSKKLRGRPRKTNNSSFQLVNGQEVSINDSRSLRANRAIMGSPKSSRKGSPQLTPKSSKQNSSAHERNVESPGPIFIRLPPKTNKRSVQKRQIFGHVADKAKLTKHFGRMVFKCHVRVKRLLLTDPLFTKKFKTNRKTVSFMETVEVFGESDVEYASDASSELVKSAKSPKLSNTSTPVKRGRPSNLEKQKNQMKNKKALENKKSKKKQVTEQLKSESSSKRARSPPKESGTNQKTKKQKSPKIKATNDLPVDLAEGKECFVKLSRRSSTSLLSVSSEDITEANASELPDDLMNTDGNKENSVMDQESDAEAIGTTSANDELSPDAELQHGSDENSREPISLENDNEAVESGGDKNESDACFNKSGGSKDEENDNDENFDDVENFNNDRILHDDIEESEDLNKEGNHSEDDQVNLKYDDRDDGETGTGFQRADNEDDYECNEEHAENFNQADNSASCVAGEFELSEEQNEGTTDPFIGKKTINLSMSTSASESFHSISESKERNEISVESTGRSSVYSEVHTSHERVSLPYYRRGKLEKNERHDSRADSSSPGLFESKTNGAKKQSPSSMTLPDNPDDLFDLLKSNKLPEPEPAHNRIPSPSQYISEDEDADPATELERMAPSPVPDLLDESDSANDSRFSLNTFFKSVRDKLSAKRSSNASPNKTTPSSDEINLRIPNEI